MSKDKDAESNAEVASQTNALVIPFSDIGYLNNLNSDCGGSGFEWECPECGESVRWAPAMWWKLECSCREWDLTIEAKGEKK